ncbi:MAG: hypothetical protein KBS35_00675, partial [Mycoplasma sp.]|nr:hypothetical protein [Candidatus Hennigella equi]
MKKNKIITSLLSITSVAAMVAPVAVSCKNDVKQCKITLSDSCSQAFKLTVTRIPANHDLSAKIYCAPNYRPSDSSEVTITVGRKTLDKSKNEYRYDLLPGRYDGPYYLLSIPAEYVTDDIVIDVNNLVEVVPVELDDVDVRHYIEPFPVASIGSTQTITIMNWENRYIMPFNYNDQNHEIYYGQPLTY